MQPGTSENHPVRSDQRRRATVRSNVAAAAEKFTAPMHATIFGAGLSPRPRRRGNRDNPPWPSPALPADRNGGTRPGADPQELPEPGPVRAPAHPDQPRGASVRVRDGRQPLPGVSGRARRRPTARDPRAADDQQRRGSAPRGPRLTRPTQPAATAPNVQTITALRSLH